MARLIEGPFSPSRSDFKPRAGEATDMVVLLLPETVWAANDTTRATSEDRELGRDDSTSESTRAGCCPQ